MKIVLEGAMQSEVIIIIYPSHSITFVTMSNFEYIFLPIRCLWFYHG